MKQKKEIIADVNTRPEQENIKRTVKSAKFDTIGARLYKKGVEKKQEKEKFI